MYLCPGKKVARLRGFVGSGVSIFFEPAVRKLKKGWLFRRIRDEVLDRFEQVRHERRVIVAFDGGLGLQNPQRLSSCS